MFRPPKAFFVSLLLKQYFGGMKVRNEIEPDFDNGDGDGDEGEQYGAGPLCQQFVQVGEVNVENIRQTVVTLQPELETGFQRGFNDQRQTGCDRSFETC